MKKMLKNTIFTIVLCLCIFLLTACKGGIKGSEAKAYINDFVIAVADEDYSKAETMLHPERPADLENFFVNIEKEKNIDFQEGIEIKRYTGFYSALYDSTIKGSSYELTMRTLVGEKPVEFTIEIVKNEAGYGIYNLDLNT